MFENLDERIEALSAAIAYDGISAKAPATELRDALTEIKRLRALADNPWFEVGDVLGHIEDHGEPDSRFIHPYCGGYFGRDDYEIKTVVSVDKTLGGGDSLLVRYPDGRHAQVTIGSAWAHPTFPDRETALRYRVPASVARELGHG